MGRELCDRQPRPANLHRLRLEGKRLRYLLELFGEFYGPGMRARLRRLKGIQRHLGAVSDCDATEALLRRHGLGDSPDARRLVAHLQATSRKQRKAFVAFWRTVFDAPGEEAAWIRYLGGRDGESADS